MWPVPGGPHHPPGPGHHQQDRDLGLAEDQHPRPLRSQGQSGGEPGPQAGRLPQPPHLPGTHLIFFVAHQLQSERKKNKCAIYFIKKALFLW